MISCHANKEQTQYTGIKFDPDIAQGATCDNVSIKSQVLHKPLKFDLLAHYSADNMCMRQYDLITGCWNEMYKGG